MYNDNETYKINATVTNVVPYGEFGEIFMDYNYGNRLFKLRSTVELSQIYPKITNVTDLINKQVDLFFQAMHDFMDLTFDISETASSNTNIIPINSIIKLDIKN